MSLTFCISFCVGYNLWVTLYMSHSVGHNIQLSNFMYIVCHILWIAFVPIFQRLTWANCDKYFKGSWHWKKLFLQPIFEYHIIVGALKSDLATNYPVSQCGRSAGLVKAAAAAAADGTTGITICCEFLFDTNSNNSTNIEILL